MTVNTSGFTLGFLKFDTHLFQKVGKFHLTFKWPIYSGDVQLGYSPSHDAARGFNGQSSIGKSSKSIKTYKGLSSNSCWSLLFIVITWYSLVGIGSNRW